MENTNVNKNKKTAKIFYALTIVSGIVAILVIIVNFIMSILSILGFIIAIILFVRPIRETPIDPNIPSQEVSFRDDRLDLGERKDGYYYTIIRMVDPDYFVGNEGEYVALKQYGSIPFVAYYHMNPELGQQNPYLIKTDLNTVDLSDMINSDIIAQNSEFFADRTDYIYTVIDMESDILKSADDYNNERIAGLSSLIGTVFIVFLSVICVIFALISKLLALIVLIAFAIFLNQYCVKAKNMKAYLPKH